MTYNTEVLSSFGQVYLQYASVHVWVVCSAAFRFEVHTRFSDSCTKYREKAVSKLYWGQTSQS